MERRFGKFAQRAKWSFSLIAAMMAARRSSRANWRRSVGSAQNFGAYSMRHAPIDEQGAQLARMRNGGRHRSSSGTNQKLTMLHIFGFQKNTA